MTTKLKRYIFYFFIFTIRIISLQPEAVNSGFSKKQLETVSELSKFFPAKIAEKINKNKTEFLKELKELLSSEKENLFIFIDKEHTLNKNYCPEKLILLADLKKRAYILDRPDILLAKIAEPALQKMALSALNDGINIIVSSGYREYKYQANLFNNYITKYGQLKAKTFSAPPGSSQHQLGTAVDFGTITDSYAKTPEGKWLLANAHKYGWSLSYPKGYEKVTGYKWECWHYRYIGEAACKFQKNWFNDIQHYTLYFIHKWKKTNIEL